jgi:ferric-dicitrate binding protein FerR (iron transport regulator)
MNMNKSVFIKYFTGDLSEEEENALLDWLDQSQANREEFQQERKLFDMLLLNASDDVVRDIKIAGTFNEKIKKWIIQLGSVAAIFLVAFGLGIWFRTNNNQTEASGKINVVEVPIGQRALITLADGTKVWLNAKSTFSFPDHFDKDNRTVQLTGEALFDVVHNESAPFLVNTPRYQVKVMGTKFDVYAYKHSSTFETTLIEGKVTLSKNNTNTEPIELRHDEQFVFDTLTNKSDIRKVATREFTSWVDGIYSFNDQLFSSIVQRLERYYGIKIEVDYPELLDFKFTGKFRQSDPLTEILDVVKKSKSFNYKEEDNKIIIYK